MARRKNKNEDTIEDLSVNNDTKIDPEVNEIIEDNPFSKIVESVNEFPPHNINNEVLRDSELVNNIIL